MRYDRFPNSVHRGHRLWFLGTIGLLATVGVCVIRLQPDLERNMKGWYTAGVVLLALLLGLIWLIFLSRMRWKVRGGVVLALALAVFTLTRLLRVDGTRDGTGLPKLVWKWTAARALAGAVPSTAPATASNAELPRDLRDVPQFFGANRDGVAIGVKLARDWSATPPRELWRQPVGAAWSAFAVVGGRAYTQEQRADKEAVTCYDVQSGRLLWMQTNVARFFEWQGGEGPRATPTVDRGHVFTIGGTGVLACRDAESGTPVWSRDVLQEHRLENLTWGVSGSPLVLDDKVIVTGGMTNGPTIFAYDRATGEPRWKSGTDKASYSSPILATLAGRRVVLSVNAASFTAHDPETGETLLDFPWTDDKWPKAAQPVVIAGDRVFLTAGYGVGCVLLQITASADGKLAAAPLWKNLRMKTQFNSASVRDGYFYGLDDGMLACVEIATGERKWKGGRFGSGQTLLVDDLLLIQAEQGAVALAEAKPDGFVELSRIPALSAKTWNHPTLAGRYLLVRNDREAVCYELPVEDGSRVAESDARSYSGKSGRNGW